jgi:hypothetical protein
MIVIGTALAVFPFANTVNQCDKECPKVLINMENNENNGFDFENPFEYPERLFLKGKCDETIWRICKDVQWTDELENLSGFKSPLKNEKPLDAEIKNPPAKSKVEIKKTTQRTYISAKPENTNPKKVGAASKKK